MALNVLITCDLCFIPEECPKNAYEFVKSAVSFLLSKYSLHLPTWKYRYFSTRLRPYTIKFCSDFSNSFSNSSQLGSQFYIPYSALSILLLQYPDYIFNTGLATAQFKNLLFITRSKRLESLIPYSMFNPFFVLIYLFRGP